MPSRPLSACSVPGCRFRAKPGSSRCEQHSRANSNEQHRSYNATRDPELTAFYGSYKWKQTSAAFLRAHPICQGCGKRASKHAHHVMPVKEGGALYSWDNLQALCEQDHSKEELRRRRGDGATVKASKTVVTVVCGPPGSGKTSYVMERKRWGDLIVDMDALYRALSGLPDYDKPDVLLPFVKQARDAVIERLRRESEVKHAWVITSGAKAERRNQLRDKLNAEVVVLETSPSECARRISQDDRRKNRWELWQPLIERWWREYEADARDTTVRE